MESVAEGQFVTFRNWTQADPCELAEHNETTDA